MHGWIEKHARWLLIGLITVHAALLAWSAVRNSVTIDEYAHLPAGAAYVQYREWSIYNQSPPLMRLVAGVPAMIAGADAPPASSFRDDPPSSRYWNYADAFTRANRDRYHTILVAGRIGIIAVSCGGLALVFWIARRLYGPAAGVLAGGIYCFCPNLAAHGSIVGTDAGTAVFTLASIWAWIAFCRSPRPLGALLAGVALAGAMLCKFSSVLILPIWVAVAAWGLVLDRRQWRQILAGLTAAGVVCVVLVNLAYGYHGSFRRLGGYSFDSQAMQGIQSVLPAWLPVPLPKDLVEGFDAAKWEIEQPFPAFMLGREYMGTERLYYPLALAVKTPLAVWALVILGLSTLALRRSKLNWRSAEFPLLGAGAFLLIAIPAAATVNIGVRYLLPIYPIAYVLVGRIWQTRGDDRPRPRRSVGVGIVLVGALALENLTVAPRFLTFFNAAAGGPIGGQAIVNDSNCDWGQGLIDLREWMTRNGVDRVQLAYFGRIDPGVYGIAYTPANQPGSERYIAVSSYYRAGLTYRMPTPQGMSGWTRLPNAGRLRRIKPVAIVGNVFYIYDRNDLIQPGPG